MKQPITEKAIDAINELNKAALIFARQMKSGELDKSKGDIAYDSAHRKVKTFRTAYFNRTADFEHLRQLQEFDCSDLQGELETANNRFGKVLKHYAKAVGAEFSETRIP
jgi:hypothetical protein